MALRVPFNPTLDGGLVDINDGSTSKRAIRIEAGEYATPFWIRTDSGIVVPVTELPWQGVLEAGQMEVLSEAPVGVGVVPYHDFRFDGYATTNDLHANTDGLGMSDNHETDITLDTLESPAGGPEHSMLYTYPDRTADGGRCTDRNTRTSANLPANTTEVWVEMVIKFENGFTTVAPAEWGCASAAELKLFFILHTGAGEGGVPTGRHGVQAGIGGNERLVVTTPSDAGVGGSVDKALFNGAWQTIRLHARLPTTPDSDSSSDDGSGDGLFRLWWNGSLDVDLQNISTAAASFSGLWLGANMNQGQDSPQRLWWNRVRAWTTDPGWS